MQKKNEYTLSGVFVVISAIYGLSILKLPTEDTLYPKFVLFLLIVLTIVSFFQTYFSVDNEKAEGLFKDFNVKQFGTVLTVGIIYIALINIIGYFVSTSIFMLSLLILLKNSKRTSIIVTIVFAVFLYLVFKMFLGVPLPSGKLF